MCATSVKVGIKGAIFGAAVARFILTTSTHKKYLLLRMNVHKMCLLMIVNIHKNKVCGSRLGCSTIQLRLRKLS